MTLAATIRAAAAPGLRALLLTIEAGQRRDLHARLREAQQEIARRTVVEAPSGGWSYFDVDLTRVHHLLEDRLRRATEAVAIEGRDVNVRVTTRNPSTDLGLYSLSALLCDVVVRLPQEAS